MLSDTLRLLFPSWNSYLEMIESRRFNSGLGRWCAKEAAVIQYKQFTLENFLPREIDSGLGLMFCSKRCMACDWVFDLVRLTRASGWVRFCTIMAIYPAHFYMFKFVGGKWPVLIGA